MTIFCGLINGRHRLPDSITEYVFSADVPQAHVCDAAYMNDICEKFIAKHNPDKVVVYVTGFTPALLALIRVCESHGVHLTAYNYDREGRKFWEQEVF